MFTKIEMLYRDTGWELLAARRNIVNKLPLIISMD
jgi:hypothetical protein